ncbi:MAG: bifunctional hydroxymethylpyrimidine kinase/phosphomethylpyrimidine kinase [Candidatus Aminicenantales bacterium]
MTLLTIAGFDPGGGAGVLLDAAVFRAFGFEAAAVLTAGTVQDRVAVRLVRPFPAQFVRAQFQALERDRNFAGLKVGMAGSAGNLAEIGRLLADRPDIPRVVDPVFRSSSGHLLAGSANGRLFLRAFRDNASVLTPNLAEAALLSGRPVRTIGEMRAAAVAIFEQTGIPCLVKGGHLKGEAVNLLYDGHRETLFPRKRIRRDVHGTGCLFSAALLAFLVRSNDLAAAARSAADWTHRAIRSAPPVGRGRAIFSVLSFPRP